MPGVTKEYIARCGAEEQQVSRRWRSWQAVAKFGVIGVCLRPFLLPQVYIHTTIRTPALVSVVKMRMRRGINCIDLRIHEI
jgi:hypothetical protein